LIEEEWYEREEVPQPSDLANVGAHVSGPPPSSPAPEDDTEPHRVTAEAPPTEAASEEQLPEFDPRVRDDFEGLLYLGALTHEFEWMGHKFVIKTLSTDELLEVGLLVKDWQGSLGEMRAYTTTIVAACTISVDGKKLPQPISSDPGDSPVRNRFDLVRRWYPTTLDVIYEQYMLLERRVLEVLAAMGKATGSSPMASTPG
jgi:hypothetical protein